MRIPNERSSASWIRGAAGACARARRWIVQPALGLALAAPSLGAQVLSRAFMHEVPGPGDARAAVAAATQRGFVNPGALGDYARLYAYARQHADSIRGLASLAMRDPGTFAQLRNERDDYAATMLILVSMDSSTTRSWVDALPQGDRDQANLTMVGFRQLADGLALGAAATEVQIYAEGSIRGAAAGGDTTKAAQTGSLGIRIVRSAVIITASMSVASSVDTVHSGFGERTLLPMAGNALASGLLDVRLDHRGFCHARGILQGALFCYVDHFYLGVARANWDLPPTTTGGTDGVVLPVPVVTAGALHVFDLFNGMVAGSPVAVTLEAGLAFRFLNGEFTQSKFDERRMALLGTTHVSFFGPQASMQLTFGAITGSVDYYALNTWFWQSGRTVSGLTRGQVAAGFRVDVPIFQGRL